MHDSKIEARCRALMESDLEAGRLRPIAAYVDLFSGFERIVEKVYESLVTAAQVRAEVETRAESVTGTELDPTTPGESPADQAPPELRDARAEALLENVQFYAQERYRYGGEIGAGAMGRVLEVVDQGLERQIAMKLLRESEGSEASTIIERGTAVDPAVHRFVREARIMARLDHPGIVPVYDFGVNSQKRIFFTMKRVEGRGLDEIFSAHHDGDPDWPLARVVQLLVRAADAVGFAHSRAVVHRDLKPPNVMVGSFGEVYVMDWGLAKCLEGALERRYAIGEIGFDTREIAGDDSSGTRVGSVIGSPTYMPPEQANGDLDAVGPASDVYGLGACLYDLLAGNPPYIAGRGEISAIQIILAARKEPPAPLAAVAPDAPAELVAIAEKAMQRAPADRYADATEFGADLQAYLEGHVVSAHRTGKLVALSKWIARNRALASLMAVILLLVVCGSVVVAIQQYRAKARVERERGRAIQAAESERRARVEAEAAHRGEVQARTAAEAAAERERIARREADGERIAAQAGMLADTDAGLALLLGLQAAERTNGELMREALATSIAGLREVHTLEDRHEGYVMATAYAPDGKTVLSGGHDRIVVLWDAETGEALREYSTSDGWTWRIRFAPDGKSFATFATDTNLLRFREVATGTETAQTRVAPARGIRAALKQHQRGGSRADFAYAPDGGRVVVYGIANAYQVIDAATGDVVARSSPTDKIAHVVFSPDGSRLGVLHTSGALSVVRVVGGATEHSWPAPARLSVGNEGWCRFRQGGTQLAAGYGRSRRGTTAGAYIRSIGDGALVALRTEIGPCVLGDDESVWVTARRIPSRAAQLTELKAIDVDGGEVRHRIELAGSHTRLVAGSTGARIAVLGGTRGRDARIWNLQTGAIDAELIGHRGKIESFAWSRDGKRAVTGSLDISARIWDTADPRDVTNAWTTPPRRGQRVVAFSVRANRAVIRWPGAGGERMALVTLDSGADVVPLEIDGELPARVTMAALGGRVAIAKAEGKGSIWTVLDTRAGAAVTTLRTPGNRGELSPDGTRFAAYGRATEVHTFDVASGDAIVRVPVYGAARVRFAPSNDLLVTCDGGNGSDTLWDLGKKSHRFHFRDRSGFCMDAAWSLDGRYYVSTATDRAVFFRDPETGKDSRRIISIAEGWLRPGWSPDGRWLFVHWGAAGRIYSVEALRPYRSFAPDGARWETAEFHPTSPELWISDTQGRILRIAIDVVAAARHRRHRQLTLGESKRYRVVESGQHSQLRGERADAFQSFVKLEVIALGLVKSGEYDRAIALYDRLLSRRPYLAILHLARARALAQRSTSHRGDEAAARESDRDAAVASLREGWVRAPGGVRHPFTTGEPGASSLEIDAALQPLIDHAGFRALVEEIRQTPPSYLR